jgi:suppressor of fused
MGLFAKIFGSRQSADSGGSGPVVSSPVGWAFIESLFADLYPGQTPKHAAPAIAPQHDLRIGRASVEGTHVYDAGNAWHYVTLGLTELYDQSDASVGPNGIRCELSMRVAKPGSQDSDDPPLWPVAFLGKIASHVSQGAVLAQGVSFRTGPIAGAPAEAGLEGAVALLDPGIEPRPGPFGKVGVILLVGLTAPQLDEIKQGGSAKVIAGIAADPSKQIT